MNDTISTFWVSIIFACILAAWIGLDIANRRRDRLDAACDMVDIAAHAVAMATAGECAHAWTDDGQGRHVHLCVRPYEHTGLCACGICTDGIERVAA